MRHLVVPSKFVNKSANAKASLDEAENLVSRIAELRFKAVGSPPGELLGAVARFQHLHALHSSPECNMIVRLQRNRFDASQIAGRLSVSPFHVRRILKTLRLAFGTRQPNGQRLPGRLLSE